METLISEKKKKSSLIFEHKTLRIVERKKNRNNEIKNGYGACKSCDCYGYTQNSSDPNDYYCSNCNHHYSQHKQ